MSMIRNGIKLLLAPLLVGAVSMVSASELPSGEALFKKKCTLCHAMDKKKLGPAVNSMSSEGAVLREIIAKGKKSMPSYGEKLTDEEIDALVSYLLVNQQERQQ